MAVLIGGQKLKIYEVKRDSKFIREMISDARVFWYNHVKTKVAPPPRSIADCLLQFPEGEKKKQLNTNPFLNNLIGSGKTIKKRMKELQGDFDEVAKEIMITMKDAEEVIDTKGDKLVTWVNTSRTSLDQKNFTLAHPALSEKFKQVSTFRTFKIRGDL